MPRHHPEGRYEQTFILLVSSMESAHRILPAAQAHDGCQQEPFARSGYTARVCLLLNVLMRSIRLRIVYTLVGLCSLLRNLYPLNFLFGQGWRQRFAIKQHQVFSGSRRRSLWL